MPNSFCNLLSNGYSFYLDKATDRVLVGPCCLHTNKIIFDGDLAKKHQDQFGSITGWVDACNHCRVLESAGQQSLRQTGPDWIPASATPGAPVMIDINLDKECNAACVICGDHSSSLWARENQKFFGIKDKIEKSNLTAEQNIQRIIDSVPLDQVAYIKFFGGEPLFTNTHLRFLEKVPHPENAVVHYTTNGSIYPNERVLEVWSRFKTIIFAASIDGVDEQFDYVRWPLPWSKVSRNLLQIRAANLSNVMFRIEFTVNFLNAFYYDKLERWISDNFASNLSGDSTEINLHHCTNSAFALEFMPGNVRQAILEKYPRDHVIYKMISNLNSKSDLAKFWAFVDRWDVRRDLRWQDCFPELVSLIGNK